MFGLFRRKEKDLTALRAYFLHHECDLSEGIPSEDAFQSWLEYECDPDSAAFYEDLGEIALARSGEADNDFWDFVGMPEGRTAWQGYQKANQGYGALVWAARVHAWFLGLPWF